jgi:hypothetical protein
LRASGTADEAREGGETQLAAARVGRIDRGIRRHSRCRAGQPFHSEGEAQPSFRSAYTVVTLGP